MNTFDEDSTAALKDASPMRLFLDPLTQVFDRTDYRTSVETFVQNQMQGILRTANPDSQHQPLLRPLAIEIWGRRALIVVDVNHYAYDWNIAHDHNINNLPIYRFHLAKDGKHGAMRRDKALDRRVNYKVAELHRLNGIAVHPPYLADHSTGAEPVQYRSPRRS